jgi:nucleoside phosphorylase/tetratricopeptide (TPR) repeat protein
VTVVGCRTKSANHVGTVVVLTALGVECQAVRTHLTGVTVRRHPAGTMFEVGALPGTVWRIALAVVGPGNLTAGVLTERAIALFEPAAVLFVGVAGALIDDLALGDVVVATRVYAYHGGGEDASGFRARPRSWEAPHHLEQLARHVERTGAWTSRLPEHATRRTPAVYFAPIAAGEVVLNARTSPLAWQLRRHYGDAAAIEMESAGAASAGHLNRSHPVLTIRGISDTASGDKARTDAAGWQQVAAENGAAFAAALVAALPAETGQARAVPGVWNLPLRNPNFTGRGDELDRIRTGLRAHATMTVQALRGMGGVGKTQTVLEYAHRYATDYTLVWWVNAEQATLIADQYVVLAERLGVPPADARADTVAAVCANLRMHGGWLLIFDNAESVDDLRPALPGGVGHVLVTTRRGGFRALGEVLDLDVLDRPGAVRLLRRRAPAMTVGEAGRLAKRLGDLPLALDQAAAYIDQTGIAPAEYLHLLHTRAAELYHRGYVEGHRHNIATVWSLSLDRIRTTSPAAAQLLGLCAWLAPDPVPLDLFTAGRKWLPATLAAAADDVLTFNEAVGALLDFCLVRRTGPDLVVHRLIQDVTRHRDVDGTQPLTTALALLHAYLPTAVYGATDNWPRWRRLLPHVLAATAYHDDKDAVAAEHTAWLLHLAGTFLLTQGRPGEARPALERALRIHEVTCGPDHPDVAADLNVLGQVLRDLGQPADARPLLERALRIREAVYGPDHPLVATVLNILGWVINHLGQPAQARPMLERALHIREETHGPDHPHVATTLNVLGQIQRELGQPALARPLLERALRIREAAHGPDHPDLAADLDLLGQVLNDLNEPAQARPLLERALHIRESSHGLNHPWTAQVRANFDKLPPA